MILIVGLGNPGKKFQNTRHNIGFRAVDAFRKRHRFSDWKFIKKYNALISQGKIDDAEVMLAKPQTYMNNSGKAVKKIASSFKLQASRIFVVHDDIYLPLGSLKISIGRGSAGHKGVESIIRELKTKKFVRFRIGTAAEPGAAKMELKTLVLKPFRKQEETKIKTALRTVLPTLRDVGFEHESIERRRFKPYSRKEE